MAGKAGLRVWYISAEDDREELDRRIAAYIVASRCRHRRPPVRRRQTHVPAHHRPHGRSGPAFDEACARRIRDQIEANRIDVVTFDPFISFHHLPENDNAAIDAMVKRVGDHAPGDKLLIEFTHHVRKPQGRPWRSNSRRRARRKRHRQCRALGSGIQRMTAIEAEHSSGRAPIDARSMFVSTAVSATWPRRKRRDGLTWFRSTCQRRSRPAPSSRGTSLRLRNWHRRRRLGARAAARGAYRAA